MNFLKRLKEDRPVILDGGMGSQLFKLIPGYQGCFELLNIENPDVIKTIHSSYISAGAEIIETNSFGGSSVKLGEYHLADRCRELNRAAAAIAREAAGTSAMVAGSVGPLGKLLEPIGTFSLKKAYDSYAEQVIGLTEGGADLIAIETMNDLQDARIALLAAKENSSLPVIVSMSFEKNGFTVSGTDMITAFATLSANGADMVGANCSLGPDALLAIYQKNIEAIKELGIPLSVWSNAGLPQMVNGKTCYPMDAEAFGNLSASFAELGVRVIGGCCGTTPDHIAALKDKLSGFRYKECLPLSKKYFYATSRLGSVNLESGNPLIVVGERLNPTARKKFAEELKNGATQFLREEAKKQEQEGAHILDLNVGVPGIDETAALKNSISILDSLVKTPLMLDSDNNRVLEPALFCYPGVPVINSINNKKESREKMLPLLKRFGSFVVALCLDESGIHREADKRIKAGEELVEFLTTNGITSDRIIIDPLMLTESAEPGSAVETLRVIEHFHKKGIKTSLGISNISFGLPQRKFINNAFLQQAVKAGLTMGIVNPSAVDLADTTSKEIQLANDFINGEDTAATNYIKFCKQSEAPLQNKSVASLTSISPLDEIHNLIVDGNVDLIAEKVNSALASHQPADIMNLALIKGLEKVGDLYSTGEYFLPQMIASANAMKAGFEVLKPLLKEAKSESLGKIIICTVHGDIHDIGKNIVGMMLENHGFEVIDLGKDVPSDTVMDHVRKEKPNLLGLSSLLTTTMPEMEVLCNKIKEENLPVKVMIGGAVVNESYAQSIGALYSEDAVSAVALAKRLVKS